MTKLNALDLNAGWERAYVDRDDANLWQDDPSPLLPWVVERLRVAGSRTVVDIGCGDGRNVAALAEAGFATTGMDVSPTALDRSAERFSRRGLPGFFVRQDITALDFANSSVDAMTCIDVFNHIIDPGAAVREITRALRPGGLFIANVFNPQDSEFGAGEEIGHHTFQYRDTMFRFYDEGELRDVLGGLVLEEIRTEHWVDPPHSEFRPYEHTHVNYVVLARKGGTSAAAIRSS